MGKRIVIALGGNALGNTLNEQMIAVRHTAKAIADLVEEGHEVIVSHGNGPQVGMLHHALNELAREADPALPEMPLSVCVALSQSYIGHDLQNALREELLCRGVDKTCATMVTQVVVDENDPAFQKPSKPIGRFLGEAEAKALTEEKGYAVMEDAGRGWRRVVASPKPKEIVEIDAIRALLQSGHIVIACGGGGIPVVRKNNQLQSVGAVIDKDFASCLMAQEINADVLIILTAVEKCAINYGKPNERWLDHLSADQARKYCEEGHFAPGSMLPKVEAAIQFAESASSRRALITLLEKAGEGIAGKTGTLIE